jgi:hypothetical protein
MNPARPRLDAKSGDPQSAQNSRLTILPLSAGFSKHLVLPFVIVNVVLATIRVGE